MFSKFIALVLLVALSPVLLLTIIVLFLEYGVNLIFLQERIGQNNSTFFMYKFRTMRIDTPNEIPTRDLKTPINTLPFSGNGLENLVLMNYLN